MDGILNRLDQNFNEKFFSATLTLSAISAAAGGVVCIFNSAPILAGIAYGAMIQLVTQLVRNIIKSVFDVKNIASQILTNAIVYIIVSAITAAAFVALGAMSMGSAIAVAVTSGVVFSAILTIGMLS